MRLLLAITSEEKDQLGHRARYEFDQAGGTIGRNASCTWALPDPTNVLSARHASISYNGRGFEITDTSTNGVYVNSVSAPIGRGNAAFLSHGDTLYFGSFELSVAILEDAAEERRRLGVGQMAVTMRDDRAESAAGPPLRPQAPAPTPRAPPSAPREGSPPASGDIRARPENVSIDALFGGAQPGLSPLPEPRAATAPPRPPVAQTRPTPAGPKIPSDFGMPAPTPTPPPRQLIPHDILADILGAPDQKNAAPSTGRIGAISPAPPQFGAGGDSLSPPPMTNLPPTGRISVGAVRTPIIPDTIDFGDLLPPPQPNLEPAARVLSPNAPPAIPQAAFMRGDQPSPPPSVEFARQPPLAQTPPGERATGFAPPPIPAALPPVVNIDGEWPASAGSAQRAPQTAIDAPAPEGERPPGTAPLSAALRADMVSLRPPGGPVAPAGPRALDPVAMLRQRAAAGQGPPLPRFDEQNAAPLAPPSLNATAIPTAPRLRQAAEPEGDVTNFDPARGRGESDAFWSGLGLDPARVPPQMQADLLAECGRALREAVAGLVPVLSARRSLKDELRMDQTRLQPKENNPLKFLASGEAVLQALIDRKLTGFLPLPQAIREGFGDIKAHEVAALVALDAVIKNLLTQFDPVSMETTGSGGKLFGRGPDKSKLWDNFVRVHAALSSNLEETTRKLVAEEFARAYAQQVESARQGGG